MIGQLYHNTELLLVVMQALYEQAGAGNPVTEMGHISVGSNYLGNSIGSEPSRMFVDTSLFRQ